MSDPVVRGNVPGELHAGYTRDAILAAAREWFDAEHIGPAKHEPTREVWRFRPKSVPLRGYVGQAVDGAGGATRAFMHADYRRCKEIQALFGWRPFPGSLNLELDEPFRWDRGYFRAQILDVTDRSRGLSSEWAPRWARCYPVSVNGAPGLGFRFEGESYPQNFLEVIAPDRLRNSVRDVAFVEAWHGA